MCVKASKAQHAVELRDRLRNDFLGETVGHRVALRRGDRQGYEEHEMSRQIPRDRREKAVGPEDSGEVLAGLQSVRQLGFVLG